jgi:hypothetical protein
VPGRVPQPAPLLAGIAVMTPAGGASGTPGPFASIAFAGITGSPGQAGRRRMSIHPVSRDMNRPGYAPKNVLSIERAQGMPGSDRNPWPACKCVFGATGLPCCTP